MSRSKKSGRSKKHAPSDELIRRYDGRAELNALLARSGALADADAVMGAFKHAHAKGLPVQPIIQALWEDEPRFEMPEHAERLFANLLGLFEMMASGQPLELEKATTVERRKAERPEALSGNPDTEWLEAAWRYLEDHPKERERLGHAFDNRHDALVSEIDASDLSDAGFAFVREVCFEIFALLELGGMTVRVGIPEGAALPDSLLRWVDEALADAEEADEYPLAEVDQEPVRLLSLELISRLWAGSSPHV